MVAYSPDALRYVLPCNSPAERNRRHIVSIVRLMQVSFMTYDHGVCQEEWAEDCADLMLLLEEMIPDEKQWMQAFGA